MPSASAATPPVGHHRATRWPPPRHPLATKRHPLAPTSHKVREIRGFADDQRSHPLATGWATHCATLKTTQRSPSPPPLGSLRTRHPPTSWGHFEAWSCSGFDGGTPKGAVGLCGTSDDWEIPPPDTRASEDAQRPHEHHPLPPQQVEYPSSLPTSDPLPFSAPACYLRVHSIPHTGSSSAQSGSSPRCPCRTLPKRAAEGLVLSRTGASSSCPPCWPCRRTPALTQGSIRQGVPRHADPTQGGGRLLRRVARTRFHDRKSHAFHAQRHPTARQPSSPCPPAGRVPLYL
jgi:hypothetical protein